MKFSASIATALLVAGATAADFDKYLPWGKRDYYCINVIQGVPEGSTLVPGDAVDVVFNRNPTEHCSDPLAEYPGSHYKFWLVNDPVRNLDVISFNASIIIGGDDIYPAEGTGTFTVPDDLPEVADDSLWYLRLDATLSNAPQMPSIYNAAGPFTISRSAVYP